MSEVVVKKGIEDVEFFGKVDRKKDGTIASTVPSWYLTQQKEDLENDISIVYIWRICLWMKMLLLDIIKDILKNMVVFRKK